VRSLNAIHLRGIVREPAYMVPHVTRVSGVVRGSRGIEYERRIRAYLSRRQSSARASARTSSARAWADWCRRRWSVRLSERVSALRTPSLVRDEWYNPTEQQPQFAQKPRRVHYAYTRYSAGIEDAGVPVEYCKVPLDTPH
jgi:hypothetical protein